MYTLYLPDGRAPRGQVRALAPLEVQLWDGCEPLCGCCEENLNPLQDQREPVAAEPSLQRALC